MGARDYILFEVLGEPQAQKRHRMGRGFNYDPSQNAKRDFLLAIQHNAPKEPVKEPISMKIGFFFARPKSHFGTGRNSGALKKTAPRLHCKKPDVDNLIKFVLDGMSKIFFTDDALVTVITGAKYYSARPRIEIYMRWGPDKVCHGRDHA